MSNVVEIRDLRKSYGAHEVLQGVNLSFKRGEIHAFLGANGAGKSTLLGCLSGAVSPSSGTIVINAKPYHALTPRLSRELGVAIIYQHFQVIKDMTIADNVFLGNELLSWGRVKVGDQNRAAAKLLSRLGVDLDPASLVHDLSTGEQQLIEIARALNLNPDILILDEPTAALSVRECAALHNVVRHLAKNENLAIVYVTHLIDEVELIADRVSILRDGHVTWTRDVSQAPRSEITRAIAPDLQDYSPRGKRTADAAPLLVLEDYRSDFTGPVDLTVQAGEIVGLFGLMGSGRTDLLESLAGARGRLGGSFRIGDENIRLDGPRDAREKGIALVASDRKDQGLFGELSALDNVLMPHFGGYAGNRRRQSRLFKDMAERVRLRPNLPAQAGDRFSGGNAQKLMIGRWLFSDLGIRVLLLDEPTQGVDIGSREELYRLLRDFASRGGCILFSSSDPKEVVTLSDRVVILARGRQVAELDQGFTEQSLVASAHEFAGAPSQGGSDHHVGANANG